MFTLQISQGAIQKIIDRAGQALTPHYAEIRKAVQCAPVNHADETTWKRKSVLEWLWLLCNTTAAYFLIHKNRSGEAFVEYV
ncbi:MAG: transposase [Desulfovibrio sp.]|nr:transposase [Desulfovibrio sp.]